MASRQKTKEFVFTERDLPVDGGTPAVWSDYKKEAWDAFQKLPYPTTQDEPWRRTALRSLKMDSFQLPNGKAPQIEEDTLSADLFELEAVDGKGGQAVHGPQGMRVELAPELAEKGVIFTDIRTAAKEHPDLVREILGQVVSPEDGKFAALAGAFADNGLFVYVPPDVRVERTLHGMTWAPGTNLAHLSQLLIYVDDGAFLNFTYESTSPENLDDQAFTAENWEMHVGERARLNFVEFQSYGHHVWSFAHKKARVERDGNLHWVMGSLGTRLSKHFISFDLVGEGAEGRISGLYFGNGDQHLTFNTQQNHLAPRTYSDLLYKGVMTEKSRSVWRGMIYVSPGSQFIDGYQANRNMILSDHARADSIPGLEIQNDDVRCTHGSTTGKVDPEQLFYLQCRGIPLEEAKRLVVYGFFEDVMKRIPFEHVKERLRHDVRNKLNAST